MSSNLRFNATLWQKKILFPKVLLLMLVAAVTVGAGAYFISKSSQGQTISEVTLPACPPPDIRRFRMDNYRFAKPLLLFDVNNEEQSFSDIKNELTFLIENKKSSGEIVNASVYFRKLSNGSWFSINNDETYIPASLVKVPILMTFLRKSEKEPGFLDSEIFFKHSYVNKSPSQTFIEKQIEPGRNYKLKDLLYAMVVKSDNNATMLLNQKLDIAEFKNLFTSLGLTEPDVYTAKYNITVEGYSKFMRVLYNASYISSENSDYALWLLSQSTFKDGMLRQLPGGIRVAHKFGEFGEKEQGTLKQLHESGIIFFNDNPVLITIMTKGNNVQQLPQVISEIARHIYDQLNKVSPGS